jgi:hypothetical protein
MSKQPIQDVNNGKPCSEMGLFDGLFIGVALVLLMAASAPGAGSCRRHAEERNP